MLIIGSTALDSALRERGAHLCRTPMDLDLMCYECEMRRFADSYGLVLTQLADYKWQGTWSNKVHGMPLYHTAEFEMLEVSESGRAYSEYSALAKTWPDKEFDLKLAPLEVLFSIKRSHRFYPRAWKKHMQDYGMMKQLVCGDVLEDITKIREKETEQRYGVLKTPSLDKTADDFFNDNVSNRTFIHDDIHGVMAHRERPMFEYIKRDATKVSCSRAKFEELPYMDRVRCVLEEAYVIALERMIIPMVFAGGKPYTTDQAFDWAIMRIGTTLCSGWFREFAVENYHNIVISREDFTKKFFRAVDDGRIKLIKEKRA